MNKHVLNNILIFTTGTIIGSLVSWRLLETKYKRIEDEETSYEQDQEETEEPDENVDEESSDPEPLKTSDLKDYYSKLNEEKYTNYSTPKIEKEEVPTMKLDLDAPFVITPEEFGEDADYETETLFYYSDKVLTDDMNYPIENIIDTVGLDSLNHFGEYEDDSVFVRNRGLNTDYEILLNLDRYEDLPDKPVWPLEYE